MQEIETKIDVENLIYEIRGKQVMLDSDLAKLYKCSNGTKDINKAVNRNINRFPEDFYFRLNEFEYENILRFQNGTSNIRVGRRYLPYVFTEQGVAMLATVLHTSIASDVSIKIMRAFVHLRRYISSSIIDQKYITSMVLKHDNEIKLLQETFDNFKPKINQIYFNGQIYDAYSKIIDIMNFSEKENNLLKEIDIEKYNKQYHNLKIIYDNTFHDRYIVLDKKEVYH